MAQTPSGGQTDKLWTISNVITLVRICLVPVFVVALLSPWPQWFGAADLVSDYSKSLIAAGIFILISCTDWLDGYLARSRNEVTNFGKFMDPLADKILVAAALLALVELHVLPSWPVLIILAREFIVSGIRMVAADKGTVIAASWYGKAKTVTQIIAIVLFIVKDSVYPGGPANAMENPLYLLSWAVMIVALVLTIVSMLDYFVKAKELLGFGSPKAKGQGRDSRSGKSLPVQVVEAALASGKTLATAESLTGGLIAAALTSVPGSSGAVRGGVVSYVNDVKAKVLGVSRDELDAHGAVSEEVVRQMAQGALTSLGVDVAVAVSGIAGPGGGEPGKPVGTVWLARAERDGTTVAKCFRFDGDREAVRRQTVEEALGLFLEVL